MGKYQVYFIITFCLSFYWLIHTSTALEKWDNVYASAVLALFGFVFWPVYYIQFTMTRKNKRNKR